MPSKAHGSKVLVFIGVAIIGALAGFGYFKQSTSLVETPALVAVSSEPTPVTPVGETAPKATHAAHKGNPKLALRDTDIVYGDVNAPVHIVEYMSLSCTHCADFHKKTQPALEKDLIETGKAALRVRHFPLNEPALKAAQLVECAGSVKLDRKNFVHVLMDMQSKWAFSEDFMKHLKQIASVGGLDSAAFESCMADQALETRLLADRKEGETDLKIDSTPYFFINGEKYDGPRDLAGFKKAIEGAEKAQ